MSESGAHVWGRTQAWLTDGGIPCDHGGQQRGSAASGMAATDTVEAHPVARAADAGRGQVYAIAIILLLANAAASKAIVAV
ncbi:MAG: hypothetical protein ACXWKV_16670, partial [Caulobacteraceae bacterium]